MSLMMIQKWLCKAKHFLGIMGLSISLLLLVMVSPAIAITTPTSDTPQAMPISTNDIYLSFEQRLVLAYLLESVGLSEQKKISLAQRMEKMLQTVSQRGLEWVEVGSLQEYIDLRKGEWPDTHRLSMDLRVLEKNFAENSNLKAKMYYSKNSEVQKIILNYHAQGISHFVQVLETYKIPLFKALTDFSLKSIKSWTEGLRNVPQALSKVFQQALDLYHVVSRNGINLGTLQHSQEALSSAVTQHLILQSFSAADSFLNSMMNEVEPIVNEILKELQGVSLNPGEMKAMEILFKGYFHELSLDSKKLMLNALLGLPINSSAFEKFQLMVQLADPVFQKCMQLFARTENMSPKVEAIFQSLESSGRKVPWFIVEALMKPELSKYNGLFDISHEPLGVGTERIYYLAKYKESNGEIKSVVIGILKPDIARRIDEGERILNKLAIKVDSDALVQKSELPKLASFIPDSMRFIRREMNTDVVRGWQRKFIEAYKNKATLKQSGITLEFFAPQVYEPMGNSSNLLVQEFVLGDKLDQAISKSAFSVPELKKMAVEQLAHLWLRELLFGDGLYHGDLHHGNIKMFMTSTNKIFLPIIDYGMSGALSAKGRSQFMKLGASIELLDPPLMADIFLSVSDKDFTRIQREELVEKIQEKIKKDGEQHVSRELDDWIKFVARLDLKLRAEFMDMMRGYFTIKRLLKEVKSEMSFSIEAKKMALQHPIKGSLLLLMGSIGTSRPSLWKLAGMMWKAQFNTQTYAPIDHQLSFKDNKAAALPLNKSSLIGQCRGLFIR